MNRTAPAWSSSFSADALPRVAPIAPLDAVGPEWAWHGSTGAGVRVAIVDSGIDAAHPAVGAVQGHVAIREEDGELRFEEGEHEDVHGHGTACAGIIRALAPDCELYSVRVLDRSLTGRGRVFAAGVRWAIEHGMHVCNLSLGTTRREFAGVLHELADRAYFERTALVTAANNMPVPSFPSVYASVISVACHHTQDPEVLYYNPSPPVEFGAAGIDVRVPWLDGSWITTTGNSFATPHVTGMVARVLGKHPGLAPFQLKSVLRALAANVGSG